METDLLRQLHGRFVTGVTVVTTNDQGMPRGLTLNAFSSLTLEPPLVMVCVQSSSATYPALFTSEHLAINILAVDQAAWATAFASKRPDKFEGIKWHEGPHGSPILADTAAWMEGAICERFQAGSHGLFIVRVTTGGHSERSPLIYAGGKFFDGGQLSLAPHTA